jgi:hypothetical protein
MKRRGITRYDATSLGLFDTVDLFHLLLLSTACSPNSGAVSGMEPFDPNIL